MIRTFRVATTDTGAIVHDPRAGVTHHSTEHLNPGRRQLDEQTVQGLPLIEPRELHRRQPVSVCWSPIVRCNLACSYCLDDKALLHVRTAPQRKIAEILAASDVLAVDISGGEPLLLADLTTLADHLTEGGLAVSVTTNGWHLERRATELAEHFDAVRVSLDGPTADIHDDNRGVAGSFDRALAGVGAANDAGIPVQIQTVLMVSTVHHAQDMVDLAARLKVGGLTFLQHLPIGEATNNPTQGLTDAQARALLAGLHVPEHLTVRLRERATANGFTVIRADGQLYRNVDEANQISPQRQLTDPSDLDVDANPDGSA